MMMFSVLIGTGILLLLGIHFLPTFVAFVGNHRHSVLILVLNVLLGWTIIGWLVLLIWACVGEEKGVYYGGRTPA
jgi:hypothetical protein